MPRSLQEPQAWRLWRMQLEGLVEHPSLAISGRKGREDLACTRTRAVRAEPLLGGADRANTVGRRLAETRRKRLSASGVRAHVAATAVASVVRAGRGG